MLWSAVRALLFLLHFLVFANRPIIVIVSVSEHILWRSGGRRPGPALPIAYEPDLTDQFRPTNKHQNPPVKNQL